VNRVSLLTPSKSRRVDVAETGEVALDFSKTDPKLMELEPVTASMNLCWGVISAIAAFRQRTKSGAHGLRVPAKAEPEYLFANRLLYRKLVNWETMQYGSCAR
jgi:hypothetical protein